MFVLQAVVVSIDPRRVYLSNPDDVEFKAIKVKDEGKPQFTYFSPFSFNLSYFHVFLNLGLLI